MLFSYLLTVLLFSGSGARSGNGAEGGQVQGERNLNANGQREVQRMSKLHISNPASASGNEPVDPNAYPKPHYLLQFLLI